MEGTAKGNRDLFDDRGKPHDFYQLGDAFAHIHLFDVQDNRRASRYSHFIARIALYGKVGGNGDLFAVNVQGERLLQREGFAFAQFFNCAHIHFAGNFGIGILASFKDPIAQALVAQVDIGFDAGEINGHVEIACGT